ncbi:MAG: WG repeat-containing protein [Clostridia bacterium]|nr:WG repeat-containing protein [Clostridia bacterium]
MKNFKRFLCILIVVALLIPLSACGKKKAVVEKPQQTKPLETTDIYKERWLLAPSIKADAIYSLPIVTFNEKTNHYDVSYGDSYVIKKGEQYGLIDSNGVLVFEPQFDSIQTCPCFEGYIVTTKDGDYYHTTYHINSKNQKLWSYEHTCNGFTGYEYKWDKGSNSIDVSYKGDDNKSTNDITPLLPEAMEIINGSELIEKFTLVNGGKPVGSQDYMGAGVFTGGLAAFNLNGKWGYVDSTGKTVIPFEFDAVERYNALNGKEDTPYEVSEGYVTVLRNGKFGIYNVEGDMIIPCLYSCLTTVHDGRAYASQDGKTWGVLLIDEAVSNGIASSDN